MLLIDSLAEEAILAAIRRGEFDDLCHPSCAIPCAVLKVAEVAMGMALPRTVRIEFDNCEKTNLGDLNANSA